MDAGVSISAAERRFFLSDDAARIFSGDAAVDAAAGEENDDEDAVALAAAAAAAAKYDGDTLQSAWMALQERVFTSPTLLQLARRAARKQIVETRGRLQLRHSIENIDRDVLPKMLKDYLLMA